MKKTALITGICGQDGSYLAEFLLERGYRVVGLIRRNATRNLENAEHLEDEIEIEEGDITDFSSVSKIIQKCRPQEIFNLAAMSHVHTSFDQSIATFNINTLGIINILEVVKLLGYSSRIFQASTSEMWGSSPPPQNEETIFRPRSPYAIAKLAGHEMVKLYRDAYKMYCCSGITVNHESTRRGSMFVTRKISMGVAKCLKDPSYKLKLGNLNAKRDWGFAPDYVRGFWLQLQQEDPDDFVFATGEMHSVKEFCQEAFKHVGLDWKDHVEVDRFFMRPAEVEELCGDYTKAKTILKWEPKVKFHDLVKIMVNYDCELLGLNLHLDEEK
ncbi:MAG: GDP-mannose 4,6-dehydratase [Candidatus Hodarchaeales archaeon]|jgi:GDPmannose 4,6-dehydratase